MGTTWKQISLSDHTHSGYASTSGATFSGAVGIGIAPVSGADLHISGGSADAVLHFTSSHSTGGTGEAITDGMKMALDPENDRFYFWNYDMASTIFAVDGGVALTLGSSQSATFTGNVGIGVSPSATNSSHDSLNVGGNGIWSSYGTQGAGGEMDIGHNFFYNASGYQVYISTDEATQYRQGGGKHYFKTASSGTAGNTISWSTPLTLNADSSATFAGNVTVNGAELNVNAIPTFNNSNGSSAWYMTLKNSDGTGYGSGIDFWSAYDVDSVKARIKAEPSGSNRGGYINFFTENTSGSLVEALMLTKEQNATFAGLVGIGCTPADTNSTNDGLDIKYNTYAMWQTHGSSTDERAWGLKNSYADAGKFGLVRSNADDNVLDTVVTTWDKDGNATFAGKVQLTATHATNQGTALHLKSTAGHNWYLHPNGTTGNLELNYNDSVETIFDANGAVTFAGNVSLTSGKSITSGNMKMYIDDSTYGTSASYATFESLSDRGIDIRSQSQTRFYTDNANTLALTLDASQNATFAGKVDLTNATSWEPQLRLFSTHTGTTPGQLQFWKKPSDNSMADGDWLGQVGFAGLNSANADQWYTQIVGKAIDITDGSEDGGLTVFQTVGGVEDIITFKIESGSPTFYPQDNNLHVEKDYASYIHLDTGVKSDVSDWKIGATSASGGLSSGDAFVVYNIATPSYAFTIQNSTGNTGIGVNQASYKLDVGGTFHASGNATFSGNVALTAGNLNVTGNGYIYAGTSNTAYGLEVQANGTAYTGDLLILNLAGADANDTGDFIRCRHGTADVFNVNAGGNAIFAGDIKSSGKVLLNNSDGEGHFSTGDITGSNTIGNDEATFLAVGNQPEWGFQQLGTDGDVGMGIYHTNGGTSNWSMKFGRGLNNSNDFVSIYTNNTERFKINSAGDSLFRGNVTVGDTSGHSYLYMECADSSEDGIIFGDAGGTQRAKIACDTQGASHAYGDLQFYTGGTTNAMNLSRDQNATFYGDVTADSGGLYLGKNGTNLRLGALAAGSAAIYMVSGSPHTGELVQIHSSTGNAFSVYNNGDADFGGEVKVADELKLVNGNSSRVSWIENTEASASSNISFNVSEGGVAPSEKMKLAKTGSLEIEPDDDTRALKLTYTEGSSDGDIATFYYDNGTTTADVGAIEVDASNTNYAKVSDYRLKENIADITDGVDRIKQLQPRKFSFKNDANSVMKDGFLAHEVMDIVPQAVSGLKDGIDADGNPKYQRLDQSNLVPLLVQAVKELSARIEELESK